MKVLITGGSGFIGSHLAIEYINRGWKVLIFDRYKQSYNNDLMKLYQTDNLSFVEGDIINDSEILDDLIDSVDVVCHMAAIVGVKKIIDNPHELLLNNINSTYEIIRKCSNLNKKLFIASSSEVYGKLDKIPFEETDGSIFGNSNNLRWSYGVSKLASEMLALSYFKKHQLKVYIGRFFNIVGPCQIGSSGMVIPRFINWAEKNEDINIHGDGNQVRTFTYVEDACKAVCDLLEKDYVIGEIINIAGKNTITIKNLAILIKEIIGSSSKLVFNTREYTDSFEDIPIRIPSTKKLESYNGWVPSTDIEEIVRIILSKKKEVV